MSSHVADLSREEYRAQIREYLDSLPTATPDNVDVGNWIYGGGVTFLVKDIIRNRVRGQLIRSDGNLVDGTHEVNLGSGIFRLLDERSRHFNVTYDEWIARAVKSGKRVRKEYLEDAVRSQTAFLNELRKMEQDGVARERLEEIQQLIAGCKRRLRILGGTP